MPPIDDFLVRLRSASGSLSEGDQSFKIGRNLATKSLNSGIIQQIQPWSSQLYAIIIAFIAASDQFWYKCPSSRTVAAGHPPNTQLQMAS